MRINPFRSWTLKFLARHRKYLTLASLFKYRKSLLRMQSEKKSQKPDTVRLRLRPPYDGGDIWLREGSSDVGTFDEIFFSDLYRSIVQRTSSGLFIIDLGANIGLATRYFAAHLPRSEILSVEPDPHNFEMLQRNTQELERAGRCRTIRAAAWSKAASLDLLALPEETAFDSFRVVESAMASMQTVAALSVGEILERSKFPRVDILKIDIEGSEVEVFKGNVDWLRKTRSLAIEFHGDSREASRFDEVMRLHGFQVDDSHKFTVLAIRGD